VNSCGLWPVLLDDRAARGDTPCTDAKRLDGLEFFLGGRQKGIEPAQCATVAGIDALRGGAAAG
jgi:hypothetical protein